MENVTREDIEKLSKIAQMSLTNSMLERFEEAVTLNYRAGEPENVIFEQALSILHDLLVEEK